jgi:hypothetical protein
MNRIQIKSLATYLSLVGINDDTLSQFIDDIFNELGMSGMVKLFKIDIVPLTAGTQDYNFPADALQLVSAFYNSDQIHLADNRDLEAYSKAWRTSTGDPKVITQDEQSAREYTIFPIPSSTSDPVIPIHGEPFGEDFPDNAFTLLYSDNRQDDIPDIYIIPVALESIGREFDYPSDHTDTEFAESCHSIAGVLFKLIGV